MVTFSDEVTFSTTMVLSAGGVFTASNATIGGKDAANMSTMVFTEIDGGTF